MAACKDCGGLIAEPGQIYGWAGKWCLCGMSKSIKYTAPDDFVKKAMEQQAKGNVKKPSFSHILNLCEQLTADQLRLLIDVLKAMHDCEVLSANPGRFKKD